MLRSYIDRYLSRRTEREPPDDSGNGKRVQDGWHPVGTIHHWLQSSFKAVSENKKKILGRREKSRNIYFVVIA